MTAIIEVRVAGRGNVRGGVKTSDPKTRAVCDLCNTEADAVVSTNMDATPPFACKDCLRARLEAMTVAAWELKSAAAGLPWGKVSG